MLLGMRSGLPKALRASVTVRAPDHSVTAVFTNLAQVSRAIGVDPQIGFVEFDLDRIVDLRHRGHAREGGAPHLVARHADPALLLVAGGA